MKRVIARAIAPVFCPGPHGAAGSAVSIRMALLLAAGGLISGCSHVGPKTVTVDRIDYSTAIGNSWKQQTLLNIVKLRYVDLPVFVDVASIVSGYSIETAITAGGSLPETNAMGGNTATLGGSARFTDRPTITYVPLTGEKFLRGLITPIDPRNIFFLIQTGFPADFILGLTVDGLNGVRNRAVSVGATREADPEFARVLQLVRELQGAGAIGMRVEEEKNKGSTAVVFFHSDDATADVVEKTAEIRRLLRLPPEGRKYSLVYSPVRGNAHELAVQSRSMLQILSVFASYVDVPELHIKDGNAVPVSTQISAESNQPPVRIHTGKERPAHAFSAIHYRDHWFWIEDGDWRTKRALAAVMFFFTLADTGAADKLPLITIPVQ